MPENEAKKVGVALARKGVETNVSTVSVVLKTSLKLMSADFLIQVTFPNQESGCFILLSPGLLKKRLALILF